MQESPTKPGKNLESEELRLIKTEKLLFGPTNFPRYIDDHSSIKVIDMLILVALCLPIQEIKIDQEKESVVKPKQANSLNQDAIEEIKKIRERVGIKLFSEKENSLEFEKQLQKLHQQRPRTARIPGRPTVEPLSPILHPLGKTMDLAKSPKNKSTFADLLFQTVGNLDQAALELEKLGEFEKSIRLRKLSKKVRKQIREMVNPRDN